MRMHIDVSKGMQINKFALVLFLEALLAYSMRINYVSFSIRRQHNSRRFFL
ncbi:conserved hypothetical protein [Vibrio crassostreae]|nr:conserved hypothetical protein [Vibrio crassostreae]CAK1737791.1 conserved hypothetical protein [Vibrio crassostreae]CAK1737794.1 conserved hypothetical protein [Vibrio crassostreae]CAK1821639.1 conserved hypothetical protein [Vibrio crassostreae]CAK2117838.1 conserved hypothetical protein [Vibrio crassostreae]